MTTCMAAAATTWSTAAPETTPCMAAAATTHFAAASVATSCSAGPAGTRAISFFEDRSRLSGGVDTPQCTANHGRTVVRGLPCDMPSAGVANFGRDEGRLPAGHAHVPRHRGLLVLAVDDEVVALGLARDRLVDCRLEELVSLRGAERRAEVGGVLLAEAHVERARAGDADAVAALAEIVGERRDE